MACSAFKCKRGYRTINTFKLMKYVAINAPAICLIALAGWMMYLDKPYWGWIIVAALACVVYPSRITSKED